MVNTKKYCSLTRSLLPFLFQTFFLFLAAQPTLPEPFLFPFAGFDRIERLAQDDRGFLWLGTNRGLFCFDGSFFRRIQHSADNTSPIDNGAINDLLFDGIRNRLWIASSRDIHALDLETETFLDLPYYREAASKGETGECLSIFQDRAGVLWFGVEGYGLIRVDTLSPRFFPAAGHTQSGDFKFRVSVNQIAQDMTQDSILWLAGGLSGLVHFNTETGRYTVPDQSYIQDTGDSRLLAATILPAREKIYLGNPWDRYGFVYDLNARQYRRLDYTRDNDVWGALAFLAGPSPDTFWACNREELLLLDPRTGELLAHFPKPVDVQTITERMLVTPQRLWIGSDKGLLMYDFSIYRVENHLFDRQEGKRAIYLNSILENTDGSRLLVTFLESRYLYEFDHNSRTAFRIPIPRLIPSMREPAELVRLQDGSILALGESGFYELRDRKFVYLPVCREQVAARVGFSRAIQDSRGQIWVSSRWGGLFKLDLETGRCVPCLDQEGHQEIRHIFRDRDDNIWVPYTGGFSVYHAKRDSFFHFPYRAGQEKTVQYPRGFAQDAAGNVWISDIVVGGLMRVDPSRLEEGIQERVVANNGPWSNQMRQMTTDQRGRIWAITKAGLQVFDPDRKTFQLHGESSGFRLRGVNPLYSNFIPSYIKRLSSGEMAVGYTNGFALFHPDSLQVNPEKPKPYILSLNSGSDTLIGSPTMGVREKISLSHDQNDLDLELSTIAWQEADKVRLRYRLTGLDDQWKETDQHHLSFYNLAPGDYTFQLYAINSAGLKAEEPLIVRLEVLPPWWRTWWAYALYFILVLTAGRQYYHYKKRQWQLQARLAFEHHETERLKELHNFKTRLYTNITHEFRTPLTIILGMAEQIRINPKEWYNEGLQMIRRNGNQLLLLINQLLQLSKLEAGTLPINWVQGDIIGYLKYLLESFHSHARSKNIDLRFSASLESLHMDYDPEKLLQIFSNLMGNALKFTPEGGVISVVLSLRHTTTGNQLELTFQDTGIGIPEEKLPLIFDRFYQAESNSTHQSGGTGIGLALTKELVKLLRGTITATSKPGQGSAFCVLLPVRRTAPLQNNEDYSHKKEAPVTLTTAPAPEEEVESISPAAGKKPLLLIIEDNLDVVRYLRSCLQKDYHLKIAADGRKGIAKAREIIPDVIISDVMMPQADGFEVCRTLKQDLLTSHIPFILLTARADADSRVKGLDCGADAYLAKPFHREELLVRLRKLIELRQKLQEHYRQIPFPEDSRAQDIPAEHTFILKVQKTLEAHLEDENFGVSQLCKTLGISRAHLYRKFTALTGQTIAQYFRSLRLHRAKRLLLSTDLTISEIAFKSGFKDPSYFTRQFRAEFGKTPSQLRQ